MEVTTRYTAEEFKELAKKLFPTQKVEIRFIVQVSRDCLDRVAGGHTVTAVEVKTKR